MRIAAGMLVPLAVGGCMMLPLGGRPNSAPAGGPSPVGHGLRELRAGFHIHCHLSHDSDGSIAEIAAAASSLGIDTVILNDHYATGNIARAPRGIQHGVLFVPGLELRGKAGNSPNAGSILAFPVREDFNNKLSPARRLEEMLRQGALNVIGHAEEVEDWSLEPFSGFEVYNLHAELKAESAWRILPRFFFLPADAFFEAAVKKPAANLAAWDRELARGRRLAVMGGHDAHANVRVLGVTLGTYPEILRLFSNHILARDRTVEAVLEAVRGGRTFLVFDFLGDGTGFAVLYGERGAAADARATLGDSPSYDPRHVLEVSVPAPGKAPVQVSLIHDGQVFLETDSRRFAAALPGPGVWRVEAYAGNRLWIVSSPMYIQ